MYRYISKQEITNLVSKDRLGVVIGNIKTNDIDEYINATLSYLKYSLGFNTNKLLQPAIIKHSRGIYTIALIVRVNETFDELDKQRLKKWKMDIKPETLCSIKNYVYKLGA